MELKVLPHNMDAEQSILSSILLNQDVISDALILNPKDFYDTKHKYIFETMLSMFQRDINIDLITLTNELKPKLQEIGGVTYITNLFNAGMPGNIKHYVDIVKECSNKRDLLRIANEMYYASFDDTKNSNEIINNIEDRIYRVSENRGKDLATISQGLMSTIDLIEENYKRGGGITGISTGFINIDKQISGLNKGDFIIIAARSSMGKTALALNIAAHVSKKNYVALFSLEMTKERLIQRILSAETMIRLENIRQGNLNDDNFVKVTRAAAGIASRKLMLDDTSGITISQIKSKCKKMKIKQGLDVVIIDYLGIIESGEKMENRQQEISKMSRKLKDMAKELDISVIALSQLNRAPEARNNKRPQLGDLRESGAIEQDADVVILLYRDDYYNSNSNKKGITECIIAKNRDGVVGSQELGWLGEFQKFVDLNN